MQSLTSKETCALIQALADSYDIRNSEFLPMLRRYDNQVIINDEQQQELVAKVLEMQDATDTAIAIVEGRYESIVIPPPETALRKILAKRTASRAKRKSKQKARRK